MLKSQRVPSFHPLLSQYIHSYTFSLGTLEDREGKFLATAYPNIMSQLIFEFFGETNEIHINGASEENAKRKIKVGTYVKVGLRPRIDIYRLPAKKTRIQKFFKIDLFPHAIFEVFRISPKELTKNWDIKLDDIVSPSSASLLCEKLWECCTGEQMIDVFEQFMVNTLLSNAQKLSYYPFYVFSKISKWSNLSSSEIASRIGNSERWVQKKCQDMTGMSLKQMQSNLRFLKALNLIHSVVFSQNPKKLSQISSECGYYDQAHFAKDFKKYSGISPIQYMRQLANHDSQYQVYLCDIHSCASKSLHSAKSIFPQKIIVNLELDNF